MNEIFKKDNVYVLVRDKKIRSEVELRDVEELVLSNGVKRKNSLYGGRVWLYYSHIVGSYIDCLYMEIDGIRIQRFRTSNDGNLYLEDYFVQEEQVIAYLNQIENLGVDSFLENYKLQLQELKREIEIEVTNLQRELEVEHNEEKVSHIDSLKKFIRKISFIIFSLLLNMNAGLDNHCYTEAYAAIINLYF